MSPYTAQLFTIQEKLGKMYENRNGFLLKVKPIAGFQGSEEEVIVISAVRANNGGSVGFLSNQQRTNAVLTRAKYCLRTLGHGPTLTKSDSIWGDLVADAKVGGCYFNAGNGKGMSKAISDACLELEQLDDLTGMGSLHISKGGCKNTEGSKVIRTRVDPRPLRKDVFGSASTSRNELSTIIHQRPATVCRRNFSLHSPSLCMRIHNLHCRIKLVADAKSSRMLF